MKILFTFVGLLFVTHPAFAHQGRRDSRDLSNVVRSFRNAGKAPRPTAVTLQCGAVVSTSISLAADLNCPDTSGFALYLVGENITLDGNGHKIIAPNAAAGLYAQGSRLTVRNLRVNGVANGNGIMAYETPGIRIVNNDVSGNLQGIVLFAESGVVDNVEISGNVARNNTLFGIRTGYGEPGAILFPRIRNNDLANSGNFGLLVQATKFELGANHGNNFDGSTNGIYLAGDEAYLHDFSLARERIRKNAIFADSLDFLTVANVDVSSTSPLTSSEERVGLDLYRVLRFSVSNLDGSGNDIGVKFENERGVPCSGVVSGSRFWDNSHAGIFVESYDGTPYGVLRFVKNCYRERAPAVRTAVAAGTLVGIGSILDDGLNTCSRDDDRDGRDGRGDCR